GIPDLVPFDMGGTSTDISLISGGQASLSADGMLAGQRIALRSLDIASSAAGGGSIASVDGSRTLRVGPESAGSIPGPACYGNGGKAATVTDANVVLGYLDAAAFMGGQRPLDRAAAEAAVDQVAASLGLSRLETAAGIYRMINLKMADGIRLMTLRRGVDPRRFALLSFGGAAGLHATEVDLDGLDWNAASLVDGIEDRFHRRHEDLYTYASRDQEVVFVNARVAAVGEVSRRGEDLRPAASATACTPRTTRQVFLGAWR